MCKNRSRSRRALAVALTVVLASAACSGDDRVADRPGDAADEVEAITDHKARIAIIGGGVSGLVAAHELHELGFTDITLFEANDEVGGKVWTLFHPETDQPYEVGAIIQSDSFEAIFDLARRTGYAAEPEQWLRDYPPRTLVVDPSGNEVSTFLEFRGRRDGSRERYTRLDELAAAPAFFTLIASLGPVARAGIYDPGFDRVLANASPELQHALFQPMDRFLADVPGVAGDASALRGRFSLFFNMTGYGFTSEVPALYHLKFLRMVSKVGLDQVLSLATMSGISNASRGYQSLFLHVKDWLIERGVDIRLGHRVRHIQRADQGWGLTGRRNRVSFQVKGEPEGTTHDEEFDVTIVATPAWAAREFLDEPSPIEKQMLDNVRYYNFVTTIFESSQLARWSSSTVFVEDFATDAGSAVDAHVIGLYNNDGSNVFTAYQFARPDADLDTIRAGLLRDVTRLGGTVDRVLVTQAWRDYFPHYSTATLTSNNGRFLADCLTAQGKRNTLFLAAHLNFESTEHMAAFARNTVRRFFR